MKTVFLDRDGVINRDSSEYIKSRSEFEFLPESLDAIRLLSQNSHRVIVITNQSAVARNMISIEELHAIHRMMCEIISHHGGNIQDIFFCPHHPDEHCDCRKPKPGLILRAARKYNIDLAESVMIGDSATDIECARNAGCGQAILVKTGYKNDQEEILAKRGILPDAVCDDLMEAVKLMLSYAVICKGSDFRSAEDSATNAFFRSDGR